MLSRGNVDFNVQYHGANDDIVIALGLDVEKIYFLYCWMLNIRVTWHYKIQHIDPLVNLYQSIELAMRGIDAAGC